MRNNGTFRKLHVLHICEHAKRRGELRKALESESYAYATATDLGAAERFIRERHPDLILLEHSRAWSVGDFLRSRLQDSMDSAPIPLLVLGRDDESDELVALALGADDYLPVDASVKRVLARVRTVARRMQANAAPEQILENGPIRLDGRRFEASIEGSSINLTPSEFKLLHEVVAAQGRVVSRVLLMTHVFGLETDVESRRIDVHVVGLRKKLGQAAGWLQTIRSLGYAWRDPQPSILSTAGHA